MCKALPDYPLNKVRRATGGILDNKYPLICGGRASALISDDCFVIGSLAKSWSAAGNLSKPRTASASIIINGTTLWLTGGRTGIENPTKSTEFFDMKGSRPGPDLPTPLMHHCVVSVNETTAIVIGGLINFSKTLVSMRYADLCINIPH
jgi:hypothetical protein